MIVAIVSVHMANGFFMNWTGQQKGEGFEYHLLVLAMTSAILLHGSGAWSLDRVLARGSRDHGGGPAAFSSTGVRN